MLWPQIQLGWKAEKHLSFTQICLFIFWTDVTRPLYDMSQRMLPLVDLVFKHIFLTFCFNIDLGHTEVCDGWSIHRQLRWQRSDNVSLCFSLKPKVSLILIFPGLDPLDNPPSIGFYIFLTLWGQLVNNLLSLEFEVWSLAQRRCDMCLCNSAVPAAVRVRKPV